MTHRYSARTRTNDRVTLSFQGRVGDGQLVNLSVPGCQLETTLPLKKGQGVQLRIQLANQLPLRVDLGVVRWVEGTTVGLEFIRMSEEDQARLRASVGAVPKRVAPRSSWSEPVQLTGLARA